MGPLQIIVGEGGLRALLLEGAANEPYDSLPVCITTLPPWGSRSAITR